MLDSKLIITEEKCDRCGSDYSRHRFGKIVQKYCDPCINNLRAWEKEAEGNEKGALSSQARKASWEKLCPPLYQNTDFDKLPSELRPVIDKVLKWKVNPKGLILIGPSGVGKTRVAMKLLEHHHLAGRRVVPMLSGKFAFQTMKTLGESPKEFSRWYNGLIRADVVLLDDLGKEKLTERCEVELFNLIEERSQHCKPVIVTSNSTGDSLEGRFDDDRAGPFLRRVREFCDSVAFV